MNLEEIKQILPHRPPMLLVESIEMETAEDGGPVAVGSYTVKGDEFFLQGHFPENPVVPGVILCEMMAQTCCALLGQQATEGATPYFTKLDGVKFRNPVKPGDTFISRCAITRAKPPFYFASATGSVDGKEAVSASLSFALVKPKE